MTMKITLQSALTIARIHVADGATLEEAVNAAPSEHRGKVRLALEEEATVTLAEPRVIAASSAVSGDWLAEQNRFGWYYWPRMRNHFLEALRWDGVRLRALDNATDRVLEKLGFPGESGEFDVRGLVLGYVQSGKTGNYTALLAKAADVGYRLFIVLAGMDKGLRMQTQLRLQADLTGYPKNPPKTAIPYPEFGRGWNLLTGKGLEEDFRLGTVGGDAILQSSQPVLMVIKKNGAVLNRLAAFLDGAPSDVRDLPMLMVDDEADSASIDIQGAGGEHEEPSVINRRIRGVLHRFKKSAYVAYTATPFANILISRDATHPEIGDDLYPRDFIVDLPKPPGYFGAEELFGKTDEEPEADDKLDVIRIIPPGDVDALNARGFSPSSFPPSLRDALLDFILAGAARAHRGADNAPATMLVHTSRQITDQKVLADAVKSEFDGIRDKLRYDQSGGNFDELRGRWRGFETVTRQFQDGAPAQFEELRGCIRTFMEKVRVSVVNSDSDDILDYGAEPGLKAIAVGGNKLSRGLTLEGLLVSYYARNSGAYDALMQMGRWFGYREGYADLTRIHTTAEIAGNFRHLAQVEQNLRHDISRYERESITPKTLGMRILAHPSLKVTGRGKMHHAETLRVSYSGQRFQTFRFPLDNLETLALQCENNLQSVKRLAAKLSERESDEKFLWRGVPASIVLQFLGECDFSPMDSERGDILKYIGKCGEDGELVEWVVAVMERQTRDEQLGVADWGGDIAPNQISRTRLIKAVNSLGVITDPKDEMTCLPPDLRDGAKGLMENGDSKTQAVRRALPPAVGIMMLYPISKHSAPLGGRRTKTRAPIYDNPDGPLARNLIGVSLSFPYSPTNRPEEYVHGAPGWDGAQ